jgi:hypothetical protein
LYTLSVDDPEKAEKLKQSLPPGAWSDQSSSAFQCLTYGRRFECGRTRRNTEEEMKPFFHLTLEYDPCVSMEGHRSTYASPTYDEYACRSHVLVLLWTKTDSFRLAWLIQPLIHTIIHSIIPSMTHDPNNVHVPIIMKVWSTCCTLLSYARVPRVLSASMSRMVEEVWNHLVKTISSTIISNWDPSNAGRGSELRRYNERFVSFRYLPKVNYAIVASLRDVLEEICEYGG